jgi:putative DNA-invertase from lambdoid prophage Rac
MRCLILAGRQITCLRRPSPAGRAPPWQLNTTPSHASRPPPPTHDGRGLTAPYPLTHHPYFLRCELTPFCIDMANIFLKYSYMPTPSNTKAAIYLRVSTHTQSFENQRPDVLTVLKLRGLELVETYEEQASSIKKRPEFERMKADARRGKFGVLVIWAIDRFGRSMNRNILDVLEMDKLGVKVMSVKEPWMDTAGPVRDLLVAIFSWVAQQEREQISARTKAGLAVARLRGSVLGRKSNSDVPREEWRRITREWALDGKPDGYLGLAARLGVGSASTARAVHLGLGAWKTVAPAGVCV